MGVLIGRGVYILEGRYNLCHVLRMYMCGMLCLVFVVKAVWL